MRRPFLGSPAGLALVCSLAIAPMLARPAGAAAGGDAAAPVIRLHEAVVAVGSGPWPPDRQVLEQLLRDNFDLPEIAGAVLGASAALPRQRERLAAALGESLLQQVRRRRPDAADRFEVTETRVIGPSEWLVLTRVVPAGKAEVMVGWRVRARPEGPRIVDVVRDGASAVITWRHDIAAALRGRDLDAVIAEIERRAGNNAE